MMLEGYFVAYSLTRALGIKDAKFMETYGNTGCGVFKGVISKIRKIVGLKSTVVKWNYWILRSGELSKIGNYLINKVI